MLVVLILWLLLLMASRSGRQGPSPSPGQLGEELEDSTYHPC
jgi:hypothetical protein